LLPTLGRAEEAKRALYRLAKFIGWQQAMSNDLPRRFAADPLERLPRYPFERLHRLLDGIASPSGFTPIVMSLGEPRRPPPGIIAETLAREAAGWGRYPPLNGTASFRTSIINWLTRRYRLPENFIESDGPTPTTMVLPATGSREAIFLAAGALLPQASGNDRALVPVPEPGYHVYGGAAVLAGAEPLMLPAGRETGFMPDFDSLNEENWKRVRLVYLCSPANPQGSVASKDYLCRLLERAIAYDFVVAADECYSEIYDHVPPTGLLEAAASMGKQAVAAREHALVFNSLSKRSSAPGLRSGFVAGGKAPMARVARLRDFAAPTLPFPILAASEALWNDEVHVEAARAHYRRNFDVAIDVLGGAFEVTRPAGGFFLWLDVGDGPAAAEKLWREAAVRTLPGAYLCAGDRAAPHADAYLRLALVHDTAEVGQALERLRNVLKPAVQRSLATNRNLK
jgi:aspartate/methionine/tyrosine aminotransferase